MGSRYVSPIVPENMTARRPDPQVLDGVAQQVGIQLGVHQLVQIRLAQLQQAPALWRNINRQSERATDLQI